MGPSNQFSHILKVTHFFTMQYILILLCCLGIRLNLNISHILLIHRPRGIGPPSSPKTCKKVPPLFFMGKNSLTVLPSSCLFMVLITLGFNLLHNVPSEPQTQDFSVTVFLVFIPYLELTYILIFDWDFGALSDSIYNSS